MLILVSALSGLLVLSTGGADEPAGVKGSAGFQLSGTIAVIDHEVAHAVEALEESALVLTAVLK